MENTLLNKYHLYSRASFFVHHDEIKPSRSLEKDVDDLFKRQVKSPIVLDLPSEAEMKEKAKSEKKRRELRKKMRAEVKKLNLMWLSQMADEDKGLIEKMTLFWHGHFACRTVQNPYRTMEMNNLLRENALGNFRDLLYAVSRSGAMIEYLHLKQNKKASPNEDFARELCELFTLGRDVDYTEKDVVEIARAFTGWTYRDGEHRVVAKLHDNGEKEIFGKRGNFSGEDVLEMILENPKCAERIAFKIYKYFVQEEVIHAEVKELSDVLYNSNYDISSMMKHLFKADWFYQKQGRMVKSPIELAVVYCKIFDFRFEDVKSVMGLQHYLGQVLFDPPNVAGWAGGRQWIDSSRLAFRLRLGSLILNRGYIMDELSPELDEMLKSKAKKRDVKFYQEVDWDLFWKRNQGVNIYDVLIRSNNPQLKQAESTNDKKTVIHLLSTPDFQLT